MRRKDLAGTKVGRLTVLKCHSVKNSSGRSRVYWECLCDCGKVKSVAADKLSSGETNSCGCLKTISENNGNYRHGFTVGYSQSKAYKAWCHAKSRCYNPKDAKYSQYGGRGIRMCDRWLNSPETFISDMGEIADKSMSIDRIDVDGDYEPDNCRWASVKQQSRNKTVSVRVEYLGETKILKEWAEYFGMNYKRFFDLYRYKRKSMAEIESISGKER